MNRCWLIISASALLLAGCGNKDEPSVASAQNQKPADASGTLQKAASDLKDTVQQTAQDVAKNAAAEADKLKAQAQQQVKEQVVSEADKLKTQAQEQVQAAKDQTAAATDRLKAQGLIDQATKLVANTKYVDAANILKQLTSLKLTPEQQKTVDDLAGKIKTALAGDATKSIGDFLKK